MRILFLTRSLVRGGAERQLVVLAKGLAARGHEIVLVCFYADEGFVDVLAGSGVRLRACGKRGRWDVVGFLRRLASIVRQERPDIVHSYMPIANLVAIALRVLFPRLPVVWGVRASAADFSRYDWLLKATYVLEARLSRLPSLVIANSEAGARYAAAAGFPSSTLRIVANGIDVGHFQRDLEGRIRVRRAWGVADGAPLIGLVGRLDPMKDQPLFLEAARRLAADASIRFVIVGDGLEAYRAELLALAGRLGVGDRLIWAPARDDMPGVYSALDLLVSCSAFGEGFSNVIAEAMACGTDIVASDVGDAAIIVDGCGEIVPPGDATALVAAIGRRLGAGADDQAARAIAARRRIAENFSTERLVEATERLLAGVMPAPAAPGAVRVRRPVTVLHLITGLERGGAETMLAKLVEGLDPARCRSIVVSMTDEGVLGARLRAAGVPLVTLGLRRGRPTPAALARLLAIMCRERPSVLQSWLYHADLLALVASWMAPGTALAWNLRCSDMELGQYSRQIRLVRRLLAWASGRPAAIIVNSEAGRRFHASLGYHPRAWSIIPNGFDTERFRPDPAARQAWRQRLGLGEGEILVGMVARVDAMKDHATFLAAAALVAAHRPDVAFVLAGRGTESLALPAGLVGRLHALGERDDVAAILAALDLAILSSAFGEGFPNVLGEAMACGVPCIATDVGDSAAIIGDTGLIVPARDPQALAAAILSWLDRDPAARREAGAAARRRIIEHFALPAIVERYASLYEGLAVG